MQIGTAEHGIVLARPRSFAGLMTLYESNYHRLRQMLGNLRTLPDYLKSRVQGDLELHIEVLERCRYTTTVLMTYWFDEQGEPFADPDLVVRIYHDARMAEAQRCRPEHRHSLLQPFRLLGRSELENRWVRNMLLYKWLEFCIDRGHGPSPA
ncbi:MAG: DUF1249 domain-containing protein [Gammaproteobacteria bacterium]|jgi:uncharacterized protein YqiB (DUF1249 family)